MRCPRVHTLLTSLTVAHVRTKVVLIHLQADSLGLLRLAQPVVVVVCRKGEAMAHEGTLVSKGRLAVQQQRAPVE